MLITINTQSRLFLIQRLGFSSREYPCNLEHIPTILKDELEPNDNFVIYEIVGVKMEKISKVALNRAFEVQKIAHKF